MNWIGLLRVIALADLAGLGAIVLLTFILRDK